MGFESCDNDQEECYFRLINRIDPKKLSILLNEEIHDIFYKKSLDLCNKDLKQKIKFVVNEIGEENIQDLIEEEIINFN